jgi:hypothetical protein
VDKDFAFRTKESHVLTTKMVRPSSGAATGLNEGIV